ncbi:MAG: TIGR02569 family protein [Sciscionella sp.]|nr:TIGR02569 family protein [Sciscionella sp.]
MQDAPPARTDQPGAEATETAGGAVVISGAFQPPAEHVRSAFGVHGDGHGELVDSGAGWRYDDVVLRPAPDPSRAAWVAQTLDGLKVPGVRVAQPLRSTDGRWVIGGWSAQRFVEGTPQARHDDVVAVAVRLHQATFDLPRPKFIDGRVDAFAIADRAAWGEEEVRLKPELGGRLFDVLVGSRRDVKLRSQLVHGDLFGTVLFHGDAAPAITDFVPYWRPPEWAAAVAVVDAVAWGGADAEILRRWSHLPQWPQALLRAVLFRLAGHALHPHAHAESLRGLEIAAHQVTELL